MTHMQGTRKKKERRANNELKVASAALESCIHDRRGHYQGPKAEDATLEGDTKLA